MVMTGPNLKSPSKMRPMKPQHHFSATIEHGLIEFSHNALDMFHRVEIQTCISNDILMLRVRPNCNGADVGVTTKVPASFYKDINCLPDGYYGMFRFKFCCADGWFYAI